MKFRTRLTETEVHEIVTEFLRDTNGNVLSIEDDRGGVGDIVVTVELAEGAPVELPMLKEIEWERVG